ncbi:hypothetical protein [Anaeromicropila populeti]|uniref:NfeD-like C-terminal, partner-binding n=1 Tax=Anaeromicropila populeti TaxID=37658 RepID=A0A1I6IQE7_9FIRM|nr:hypothetical protein [Anaeromicropila populeti]SFR68962.1 hypothetical protein SAMN05661086_01035 [Anaeromicropila populeti]
MDKIYFICIVVGIAIPAITLIIGEIFDVFDGIFDAVDSGFDFNLSFHIGGIEFCYLPFSLQCVSAGLLIFGCMGKIFYNGHNTVVVNIAAGAAGYVIAIILQTLIRTLKNISHTTYAKEELLLYDGKVINTIVKGGFGSVSITTLDGITTNYPAKAAEKDAVIRQDSIVRIIRFDRNVAIVEKKQKN